jgi:hypothetical protein
LVGEADKGIYVRWSVGVGVGVGVGERERRERGDWPKLAKTCPYFHTTYNKSNKTLYARI